MLGGSLLRLCGPSPQQASRTSFLALLAPKPGRLGERPCCTGPSGIPPRTAELKDIPKQSLRSWLQGHRSFQCRAPSSRGRLAQSDLPLCQAAKVAAVRFHQSAHQITTSVPSLGQCSHFSSSSEILKFQSQHSSADFCLERASGAKKLNLWLHLA